jgi:hypothetical protein
MAFYKLAYTANIIAAKMQKTSAISCRSIQGIIPNPTPNETKVFKPIKELR